MVHVEKTASGPAHARFKEEALSGKCHMPHPGLILLDRLIRVDEILWILQPETKSDQPQLRFIAAFSHGVMLNGSDVCH